MVVSGRAYLAPVRFVCVVSDQSRAKLAFRRFYACVGYAVWYNKTFASILKVPNRLLHTREVCHKRILAKVMVV